MYAVEKHVQKWTEWMKMFKFMPVFYRSLRVSNSPELFSKIKDKVK